MLTTTTSLTRNETVESGCSDDSVDSLEEEKENDATATTTATVEEENVNENEDEEVPIMVSTTRAQDPHSQIEDSLTATVWQPKATTTPDAACCERSRSVRLANGCIRTRIRTRTHCKHHGLFWDNGQSLLSTYCTRSRTVRLADGSIRTRIRTITHRSTHDSPFWKLVPAGEKDMNGKTVEKATMAKTKSSSAEVSVRFGEVRVREYERVIDSTALYMGLALGWNWFRETTKPVTDQEFRVETTSSHTNHSQRHDEPTRMRKTNGNERYGMLMRYGYGPRELKQATKEAHAFYKQRTREEARSLVVAEHRKQQQSKNPGRRPLLRSTFG